MLNSSSNNLNEFLWNQYIGTTWLVSMKGLWRYVRQTNFFLYRLRTLWHWQVKMTSLQSDSQAKVKSSSFCSFPAPLLVRLFWIKALCVLKVSGFPGPVADAASQILCVHTTNKQAQEVGWEITAYYPLLSVSDSQQTAPLLSDAVITFRKKGELVFIAVNQCRMLRWQESKLIYPTNTSWD